MKVVALSLPPCAWLLDLRRDTQTLFRGQRVEAGPAWFFEGAWDAEFNERSFLGAGFRCGSGGTCESGSATLAPPSHSLEAIYCFAFRDLKRWLASNSFACLLGFEPGIVPTRDEFPEVATRARSIKSGTIEYERTLYASAHGTMYRIAFTPFRISCSTNEPVELSTNASAEFNTYEQYFDRLVHTAGAVVANAMAPERGMPYRKLLTSISSGYDSPACAVVAKHLGCTEAVSLRSARGDRADSGEPIAKALGINCYEYDRFATGIEMRMEKDYYLDAAAIPAVPHIDAFLGSLITREDAVLYPFAPHLPGRIFFTGFHGDKIWSRKRAKAPLKRGDNSGAGLCEFRLRLGFVHLPLPFIGADHQDKVTTIANSDEMIPFTVDGSYDRPIPRRVVEQAGVPRESFGQTKKRASVLIKNRPLYDDLIALAKSCYSSGAVGEWQ